MIFNKYKECPVYVNREKLNIEELFSSLKINFNAYPIINGKDKLEVKHKVFNPSDLSQCIGEVAFSSKSTIEQSIDTASLYFSSWKNINIDKKISIIILTPAANILALGNVTM